MANQKVKVKLNGGPRDGEWVDYFSPLPKTIVVSEVVESHSERAKLRYHSYERESEREYRYSG